MMRHISILHMPAQHRIPITVTLPAELVQRIDHDRRDVSRSMAVQRLIEQKIGVPRANVSGQDRGRED